MSIMTGAKTTKQLKQEELLNVVSHGIGLLLGIIGFVFLLRLAMKSNTDYAILSACFFGISLMTLYAASTIYHLAKMIDHKGKNILQTIDHINIYYLIAGTYTPFLLLSMIDKNGFNFFVIIWSIACAGTLYKLFFTQKYQLLSLLIYLAMGWLLLVDIQNFFQSVPRISFLFVLIGGLFYSGGTIFYAKESIRYNHLYWHIFVMLGSIFHYVAVYLLYLHIL